jgi:hypothetical protein
MLLLAVLLWLAWSQQWWKGPQRSPVPTSRNNTTVVQKAPVNEQPALNRHSPLRFTRHARCRMACRQITVEEVEDILAYGKINTQKSNPLDEPCPTYALEGDSDDGQHLRIVFAPCEDEDSTSVITCIDLDKEWACSCN